MPVVTQPRRRKKYKGPLSKRVIQAFNKIESLPKIIRKRPTLRKRLSAQKLPLNSAGEVSNILFNREGRLSSALKGAGKGLAAGTAATLATGYAVLEGANKKLLFTAVTIPALGLLGAVRGLKERKRLVKLATAEFANILKLEIRTGSPDAQEVKAFLKKHKYVFIDKYGRLAGTRMPTVFGIGRIRIKSSDILE